MRFCSGWRFVEAETQRVGGWIASLAVVPGLQLGVIGLLALVPDQPQQRDALDIGPLDAKIAAQGLMVGVGLVFTVALSALFFHLYGYVLFLAAPFLIAYPQSTYLANRDGFIGAGRTFSLVFSAFLLGGAALMGFAAQGALFACFSPVRWSRSWGCSARASVWR